jgi:hypothetical protein
VQKELEELFNSQNNGLRAGFQHQSTSIPATFLRVTVDRK